MQEQNYKSIVFKSNWKYFSPERSDMTMYGFNVFNNDLRCILATFRLKSSKNLERQASAQNKTFLQK